jgi:hypothetical protein
MTDHDHKRFPYEIERGGITLGLPMAVSDDEIACAFELPDKTIAPSVWVAQDFPARLDGLHRDQIGLDDDQPPVWVVRARHWPASNLLVCIISPLEAEPSPAGADADELDRTERRRLLDLAKTWGALGRNGDPADVVYGLCAAKLLEVLEVER